MKSKNIFTFLLILLVVLVGCNGNGNGNGNDNDNQDKVEVTLSEYKILENTLYETTFYNFKTNVEGPKILIVGGIHGDELAGWHAATTMLDYEFTFGDITILPKANILATKLEKRYPGQGNKGNYKDIIYSDLNRTFPGKKDGTKTEQIAYYITEYIEALNPDIILDLHESLRSYTAGNLGSSIIYGNVKSSLYALDLVDEFNSIYQASNNVKFTTFANPPENSLNEYFSQDSKRIVFTFETDRTLLLQERIEQQLLLIDLFFKQIKPN